MIPFRFVPGRSPLLISAPHVGTFLPEALTARMTPAAKVVPDTDWHVDRLYQFAQDLGANLLVATHSRYVVDLNRPPDGSILYPGASNSELCPLETFKAEPIYQGAPPDAKEIAERIATYWKPYHDCLASTLARLRAEYGVAVLFDTHSIAAVLPRFFEGRLWDLNLGTGGGSTADPDLEARLWKICDESAYTAALNARFKGGYITRNYGKPAEGIHAVQLELAWPTYMDDDVPYGWREERAGPLQARVLRPMVETMLAFGRERGGG